MYPSATRSNNPFNYSTTTLNYTIFDHLSILTNPNRKPISVPPPQKHYKIVFIKAPSPPTPAPPVIPPLQQNEEKTLVYVLVKKQEEPEEIIIPTPAATPPSKPEVYFIRYKTQVI